MSWHMTLTLRVQRFEISFKLMLTTWVEVFLQGRNTLTCHQQCHLDESDSVGLPIVREFVDYMDSRATFTVKMVPYASVYESNMHHILCVSLCKECLI